MAAHFNRLGVAGLRRFGVRAPQPPLVPEEVVRRVSSRVDSIALGAAIGIVIAVMTFVATAILVLRDGPAAGIHLSLLSNYWPGYDVSVAGALMGAVYGGGCGFAFGAIRLWANMSRTHFLDQIDRIE